MFSFFKKIISSVVRWPFDASEDIQNEEQIVVDYIEFFKDSGEKELKVNRDYVTSGAEKEKPIGHCNETEFNIESFNLVYRNGKVTHLTWEYGFIDNVIYFKRNQIAHGLTLKVDDEVSYSTYKVRQNEADRVYKIYSVKHDSEGFEMDIDKYAPQNNENVELHAFSRVITGRVTQRRDRKVYIEPADIWCDLDKVQTNFIPLEGDWVELSASVSINPDTANMTGDILDVKSIKPLLMKKGCGRITFWSSIKKDGAIENLVYFTSISCEEGFIPSLGDKVEYLAIESDQDRFSLRAIKVFASKAKSQSTSDYTGNHSTTLEETSPFRDKNGISIEPAACFVKIEFKQTKTVVFKVTNNGQVKQLLKNTEIQPKTNSQLLLLNPVNCNFFIHPNQSVLYEFECQGKHLGLSGQVVYFYFQDFTIAKQCEISVEGNREMDKLLECKIETVCKSFRNKIREKNKVEPDLILYGPRPWKPPKFSPHKRKYVFEIPKKLWDFAVKKDKAEFTKALNTYAPYLKKDINFKEYEDRFHTLLWLEEIELKQNFQNYDMEKIFLNRNDDYFVLNVPGLIEKRPSLIVGDKVVVTRPWKDNGKVQYVGFIYSIQAKTVFIKFENSFHKSYDDSECCVTFEPNTNFFSRCHEAVNRAIKTHGEHWLFPKAVNEKPPLISLDIYEDEKVLAESCITFFKAASKFQSEKKVFSSSCHVRQIETALKSKLDPQTESEKKDLIWVNKGLNERQKQAVVGVLEGKGRPLPYIIFGPPGTGKTVTLVEAVIQIYRMIPESRILITTPSNSAGDLICERLIDSGQFKPGQLLRLVAFYRVLGGLIPPKLIPYSTFVNFKGMDKFDIKSSSFNELLGKQRITVSTCVTVGLLHHSGFPPGHFTHIFVDEAGQTSEPEILITTTFQNTKNCQVVLAGDPLQLGPVIFSNLAKNYGLGISLLQRLTSMFPYTRDVEGFQKTSGFDPRFITKLNVNYRSVPEILSLPSQLFYHADLIPIVSQNEGKEAEIIKKFDFKAENRTTPPAIIFHGIVGQNYQESDSPSWFNPHEIWQIVFYMRKLYSIGLKCDDVGILSPYAKQVQKLKNLLLSLEMAVPKIGSVEEFQGQERQVIIVTTVRSTPKYFSSDFKHSLGFVASPQRLNVALTRARALLIIVGNPVLLAKDPYWINVVKYCVKNKGYTGCSFDTLKESLNDVDETKSDIDVPSAT